MSHKQIEPANHLCISCGLCCDGTLFAKAVKTKGENLEHFIHHLTLIEGGFKLPCPLHHPQLGCTIYNQQRPKICSSFKCKLLNNLEKGKVDLEQAIDIVQKTKTAKSQIIEEIETVTGTYNSNEALNHQLNNVIPEKSFLELSLEERKKYGKLYILKDSWRKRLKEHFLKNKKKKTSSV